MRASAFSTAFLALLVGCGGGGGGGGTVSPTASPVAITASNYQAVAQKSVAATTYLMDSTSFVTGAEMAPRGQVLIAFTRAQIRRLPGWFATAPRLVTGAVTTESKDCSGGGTVTVTSNDLNGNLVVDAGDSATLLATDCVEFGVTINGTIGVDVRTLTGSLESDNFSASIVMTLSSLRAVSDAGSVTGNGSISLAMVGNGVNSGSVDMTIDGLTMAGQVGGVTDTLTLQGWRITSTLTPLGNGSSTSTTVEGTFISDALGPGSVTVATKAPFVQADSDVNPVSGRFIATGANGSKIRLTAQNATSVLLELDADGDNAYETSTTEFWSALI